MSTSIRYTLQPSSLGQVLCAFTEKGCCAIFLDNTTSKLTQELKKRFPQANLIADDKTFKTTASKIIKSIEDPKLNSDIDLDIQGTKFQQQVWRALQKIPVGKTVSYSDIAKKIGSPQSVRAVAQACGANKLAILIPCHRVLRLDGSISGYRWGVERKRSLLQREGVII